MFTEREIVVFYDFYVKCDVFHEILNWIHLSSKKNQHFYFLDFCIELQCFMHFLADCESYFYDGSWWCYRKPEYGQENRSKYLPRDSTLRYRSESTCGDPRRKMELCVPGQTAHRTAASMSQFMRREGIAKRQNTMILSSVRHTKCRLLLHSLSKR